MSTPQRLALILAAAAVVVGAGQVQAQAIRTNTGFTSNTLTANDDGSTGLVNLGFLIDFFGVNQSGAYLNNNGNITFTGPMSTYTPFGLAGTNTQIIAPFFGDVDTRSPSPGLMTYGTSTVNGHAAFGVNWLNVLPFYAPNYNCTVGSPTYDCPLNSFQLVMINRSDTGAGNFDFEFNYGSINWEAGYASGGSPTTGLCTPGDSNCYPAVVGWSNGGTNTFQLAGSDSAGAFLDGGPYSLAANSLNSTVTGRYVFSVRNGAVVPPTPTPGTVPEPTSILLLGTGLLGLGLVVRRRQTGIQSAT